MWTVLNQAAIVVALELDSLAEDLDAHMAAEERTFIAVLRPEVISNHRKRCAARAGVASAAEPRQRDVDLGAARTGRDIDPAVVHRDEAVDDRHPHAGAALLRREERLEHTRADLVRHPGTIVLDPDVDGALGEDDLDLDVTVWRRRLDRVADQILDDLVELPGVDRQLRGGRGAECQRDRAALRVRPLELDDLADYRDDIVLLEVKLGRTRECEELVQHLGQPLDLVMSESDRLDELGILGLLADPPLEQLELELRGVQRVANLVGEAGAHRLERRQPVCEDLALAQDEALFRYELVVAQHQRERDIEQLVDRSHVGERLLRRVQLRDLVEVSDAHDVHGREHVLLREADPDVDATDPRALLVEREVVRAEEARRHPLDQRAAPPLDLVGAGGHLRGPGVRPHRRVELVGDRRKRGRELGVKLAQTLAIGGVELHVLDELVEDHGLASAVSLRTTSRSERGASLYWCKRYWIVRVLMPSISAAFDGEPPVAFIVSRIA